MVEWKVEARNDGRNGIGAYRLYLDENCLFSQDASSMRDGGQFVKRLYGSPVYFEIHSLALVHEVVKWICQESEARRGLDEKREARWPILHCWRSA